MPLCSSSYSLITLCHSCSLYLSLFLHKNCTTTEKKMTLENCLNARKKHNRKFDIKRKVMEMNGQQRTNTKIEIKLLHFLYKICALFSFFLHFLMSSVEDIVFLLRYERRKCSNQSQRITYHHGMDPHATLLECWIPNDIYCRCEHATYSLTFGYCFSFYDNFIFFVVFDNFYEFSPLNILQRHLVLSFNACIKQKQSLLNEKTTKNNIFLSIHSKIYLRISFFKVFFVNFFANLKKIHIVEQCLCHFFSFFLLFFH